jgi:hypothetical protein
MYLSVRMSQNNDYLAKNKNRVKNVRGEYMD